MIRKLKNALLAVSSILLIAAPAALVPAVVSAAGTQNTTDALCEGAVLTSNDTSGQASGCSSSSVNGATGTLASLASTVINIFSIIVGVVSVIMIIIGGFRYVTSGGESNNVSSAKNTIIYAIIGLVVVALAQFIVKFVLQKLSGAGLS